MKKIIPITLFLYVNCLNGAINSNGDFQIWLYNYVQKEFTKRFSIGLETEFRIGNDAGKLYYVHEQIYFNVNVYPWLTIAPGYRQIQQRSSDIGWRSIFVPFVDITFAANSSKIEFTDRSRIMYLFNQTKNNPLIYRNLPILYFPIKAGSVKISPFIGNEVFFQQKEGFNQNRLMGGFFFTFTQTFSSNLYYMRRYLKRNHEWTHQNVLYFGLFFYF